MKLAILVRLAMQSILKNRTRAMLTMLGIVIGVAAVIVMVAVGYGARSRIREQIDNLGTNMIVITPGASTTGGVSQGAQAFATLTVADAEKIRSQSETLVAVSPVIVLRSQVIAAGSNWRTMVNGVDPDYIGGELGKAMKEAGIAGDVGLATGFVLKFSNGLVAYLSGDTGIVSDQDLVVRGHYAAKLAVMNIGDGFTTGPAEAAYVMNDLV